MNWGSSVVDVIFGQSWNRLFMYFTFLQQSLSLDSHKCRGTSVCMHCNATDCNAQCFMLVCVYLVVVKGINCFWCVMIIHTAFVWLYYRNQTNMYLFAYHKCCQYLCVLEVFVQPQGVSYFPCLLSIVSKPYHFSFHFSQYLYRCLLFPLKTPF